MEKHEVQALDEQEIDLVELFNLLWHRAWILAIAFVVGLCAAVAVTSWWITPQYKATSIIYILSKTTSITSLTDLQIGSSLAADFQIIATTREVVEVVMRDTGIDDSYESFVKTIEVTNPNNSHMLQITVTNEDPALAAKISNALAEQLKFQIAEIMSTDTPSTVQRAIVPEKPSSPNLVTNMAIGGLGCLALAAAVILMSHFLDDTIKDEDDVTRYLGLDILAAVPLQHNKNTAKRSRAKPKQAQQKAAVVAPTAPKNPNNVAPTAPKNPNNNDKTRKAR